MRFCEGLLRLEPLIAEKSKVKGSVKSRQSLLDFTMAERKGTSATRAKNKWNDKNYDRLYPYVKLGKKAVYLRAVEAGKFESLNELLESAVDERVMQILGLKAEEFEKTVKAAAEEEKIRRGIQ